MTTNRTIPEHIFVGHIENEPGCSDDEDFHEIWPKFMVMVFFSGHQTFEIDGQFFSPGVSDKPRIRPKVFLLNIAKFCNIRFFNVTGENLTKVMVSAPRTWIERIFENFDPSARSLQPFLSEHLQNYSFYPNATIVHSARQILNPPDNISQELLKLHERKMGMEVLYESCLSYINDHQSKDGKPTINYSHFDIAQNARNYILSHLEKELRATVIANALGVTMSTLNRAFKTVYDETISGFICKERMKKARFLLETQGMAVSQAGYLVGYYNPSNFATAYRREYGIAPKEHRLKNPRP